MKKVLHAACRITLAVFSIVAFTIVASAETDYTLKSPDDRIEVTIHAANKLTYDLSVNGKQLMKDSGLALTIENKTLGENPHVQSTKKDSVDKVLEPVVKQKSPKFTRTTTNCGLKWTATTPWFFAPTEGVAYRFETSLPVNDVKVYNEELPPSTSPTTTPRYYPHEESFMFRTTNASIFRIQVGRNSSDMRFASLPAVVDAANGVKVAIAESDHRRLSRVCGCAARSDNGLAGDFRRLPAARRVGRRPRLQSHRDAPTTSPSRAARARYPWRCWASPRKTAT